MGLYKTPNKALSCLVLSCLVNKGPSSIKCHSKDLLEQAAFWQEVKVVRCLTSPYLHHQ